MINSKQIVLHALSTILNQVNPGTLENFWQIYVLKFYDFIDSIVFYAVQLYKVANNLLYIIF